MAKLTDGYPDNIISERSPSYSMPAPVWKRVFALIFDLILVETFIISPFAPALQALVPAPAFSLDVSAITPAFYMLVFLISMLAFAYFTLSEYLMSQTPGKMLFSLYVESEAGARAGNKISLSQAIIRNLVVIPLFPFVLFWIIDPAYLFLRKKRLLEALSRTRTMQQFKYQRSL